MSRIEDPDSLREHLQTAIEIEWSTIPPYLCALWSLGETHNRAAAACIRDVVMEEMLHLTLVANVLNALGGDPDLSHPPRYPASLPHSDRSFEVSLLPFCPEALDTFLHIERPALIGAPPQDDGYATIAQFYEAVGEAVERIGADPSVWTGRRDRQVAPDREYYGGGGDAIVVSRPQERAGGARADRRRGRGLPGHGVRRRPRDPRRGGGARALLPLRGARPRPPLRPRRHAVERADAARRCCSTTARSPRCDPTRGGTTTRPEASCAS